MWRGCNEHHLCSSVDGCEGQLCPSEDYSCGCHGKVSLGKHPSSIHYAEEMKMSRNGDSRQSASSDQIWQHTCLVHHSLSLSIAGLATKETEQPLQPWWTETTSAVICFYLWPHYQQQARSHHMEWPVGNTLQSKSLSLSMGAFW